MPDRLRTVTDAVHTIALIAQKGGTGTIAGHFSQAVHRQLRMLGTMQGRTVQSLLGEALDELFRKDGHLPIARAQPGPGLGVSRPRDGQRGGG